MLISFFDIIIIHLYIKFDLLICQSPMLDHTDIIRILKQSNISNETFNIFNNIIELLYANYDFGTDVCEIISNSNHLLQCKNYIFTDKKYFVETDIYILHNIVDIICKTYYHRFSHKYRITIQNLLLPLSFDDIFASL